MTCVLQARASCSALLSTPGCLPGSKCRSCHAGLRARSCAANASLRVVPLMRLRVRVRAGPELSLVCSSAHGTSMGPGSLPACAHAPPSPATPLQDVCQRERGVAQPKDEAVLLLLLLLPLRCRAPACTQQQGRPPVPAPVPLEGWWTCCRPPKVAARSHSLCLHIRLY